MNQYESINDMLADVCERYRERKAYTCLGHSLSYGDVDRLSRDFAAYLQHYTTLAPGDRIAIQLPNLLQYPIVVFGAVRSGIVIVNINPLYTARELEYQLNDSGAKALVVLSNLAKAAEAVVEKTNVQKVILTEVADLHPFPKRQLINGVVRYLKKQVPHCVFAASVSLRKALDLGQRDSMNEVKRDLNDLSFLQYTGGTTGVAKGAMLSQANLLSNSQQLLVSCGEVFEKEKEKFLAPLPLYHIYGFNIHCLVMPAIGAESFLIPNARDIDSVIKVMKNNALTGIIGINTLYIALMNHPEFSTIDFSQLKTSSAGGMALATDTAKRWEEKTGCRPAEGYGLTETSPIISSNSPSDIRIGTIGKAVSGTEVKVINATGESLPIGEAGELCARGPQVMQGYWKQEEATKEVLSKDGWFRTGDIATIDEEGFIRIVDRQKDMIIVSGFNVYPNEVEEVLVSHKEIIEVAVIGVPDKNSGEAVKAFVVRAADSSLEDEEIKQFCRESLTAYKIPRIYEFRDELPKTNVGKVLRRALRAQDTDS